MGQTKLQRKEAGAPDQCPAHPPGTLNSVGHLPRWPAQSLRALSTCRDRPQVCTEAGFAQTGLGLWSTCSASPRGGGHISEQFKQPPSRQDRPQGLDHTTRCRLGAQEKPGHILPRLLSVSIQPSSLASRPWGWGHPGGWRGPVAAVGVLLAGGRALALSP